jgi:hypothetical protein
MRLAGIAVNLLGFLIALSGLFISTSNTVRLLFAVAGIAVTLFGIFGLINRYYLARAIWKK